MAESQTADRDLSVRGSDASSSAANDGIELQEQSQPPVPSTNTDSTGGGDCN